MPASEWTDREHVDRYLARADEFPRRLEGESVLLEHLPRDAGRVLDLGTGDGRLLAMLQADRTEMRGVGVDCSEPMLANFEHVTSPTARLHESFFEAIGERVEDEDPSDRLLDVETQLGWLREIGFDDVDCYWKWLEMALLIGVRTPR
ncbi:MAG: class I SAM-dependent methyltransferase [Thermoleophilaceae bacterium]